MYLIGLILFWVAAAIRWGKWSKLETIYPTLLYFMTFTMLLNLKSLHYPLWRYVSKSPYLNHSIIMIAFSLIIIPIGIFLYLSNTPQDHKRSYIYTVLWIIGYSLIMYSTYKFGLVKFYNGWKIQYAIGYSILIFIFVRLHQHKPIWTFLLTAAASFLWFFLID